MNTRGREDRLDFQPDIKGLGEEGHVKEEGALSNLSVEKRRTKSGPESDFKGQNMTSFFPPLIYLFT